MPHPFYLLYHNFVNISSVAVRIYPQFCLCGESISKNAFRKSESIQNAVASMPLYIIFELVGACIARPRTTDGRPYGVAVRICPQFCLCGESISKNAFRRFESVYRPEIPENLRILASQSRRRRVYHQFRRNCISSMRSIVYHQAAGRCTLARDDIQGRHCRP